MYTQNSSQLFTVSRRVLMTKTLDRECSPQFSVSCHFHLASILFINMQSKSLVISAGVLGFLLHLNASEFWFGSQAGCGLCMEVQ